MKFTLARLTSQPAQDALKSLNVELTDAQGNIRDVMQVYTEVAQRMKGLSEIERSTITEGLAGKDFIW